MSLVVLGAVVEPLAFCMVVPFYSYVLKMTVGVYVRCHGEELSIDFLPSSICSALPKILQLFSVSNAYLCGNNFLY